MSEDSVALESLQNATQQLAKQANTLVEMSHNVALPPATIVNVSNGGSFSLLFTIFILACFVGYYVVWRVTPALHTPLMAVTNAISAIVIIGGVLAAGSGVGSVGGMFGVFAIFLASVNIFGGFVVTQRMLSMFKKRR